jgi:hypothetical protein
MLLCCVLALLASIVVGGLGERTPAEVVADIIAVGDRYSPEPDIGVADLWGLAVPTPDGQIDLDQVATDNGPRYRLTDESIKRLCQASRVCTVYGHRWERTPDPLVTSPLPMTISTDDSPDLITIDVVCFDRTCTLCGLRQTRKLSDWKDEKE